MKLSFLFLTLALCARASTAKVDSCEAYLRDFYGVTYFEPVGYWASGPLNNELLASRSDGVIRAQWIVRQFFDRNSALWREAQLAMPHWSSHDPDVLKTVFRATEMLYYSRDAAKQLRAVDSVVPTTARILQLGGATGWQAGYLLRQQPRRTVHISDPYEASMDLAMRRLRVLLPQYIWPKFKRVNTGPGTQLPDDHYNVVISNQAYYKLVGQFRDGFFDRMANTMHVPRNRNDSASLLILNEPVRDRESYLLPWTLNAVAEAIEAGSPHSDFDVAITAMFLSGLLGEGLTGGTFPAPEFVDPSKLIAQAHDAGFKFVSQTRVSSQSICDHFVFEYR